MTGGIWRNAPYEVCALKRTKFAEIKISAIPAFGVVFGVIVLAMGVLSLLQGDEHSGLRFATKTICAVMAVLVWIFSICLFFSQWQLQGSCAGLALFVLIIAGHAKNDMRFGAWIATGLYIFAYWWLNGGTEFGYIWSQKFKKSSLSDCVSYFDGYFEFNGANFNGAADPIPWNINMKGNHAVGNPSRYHGYCKGDWQVANTFMLAFFVIAAFTNLACLTATLVVDPSAESAKVEDAPEDPNNQPTAEEPETKPEDGA
jgi:hypothetical protein